MTVAKRRRASQRMLFLVEKYLEAHPDEGPEVDPDLVAEWAYERGMWKYTPKRPEEVLRGQIARALRDDYMLDPQGREIRKHHPVVDEVMTPDGPKRHFTWYPIFTTAAPIIRQSFQLRRRAALQDVIQLSLDFDSYNDNNTVGGVLEPMDYDFNKDLEELSFPTDYPDGLSDREYDDSIEDDEEENDDDNDL